MKSKTFPTEKSWSYLFTDTILERGRDYYEDGAVDELSVDPDENTVSATVSGSTDYETVITLSENWKRVSYIPDKWTITLQEIIKKLKNCQMVESIRHSMYGFFVQLDVS